MGAVLGCLGFVLVALHRRLQISPNRVLLVLSGMLRMWVAWVVTDNRPRAVQSAVHGSARFATLCGPSGLIVGRYGKQWQYLLRADGPAHLLTIAPTRSGKGVGATSPNS